MVVLTYDERHFLRDGAPHQIVAGSLSYWRLLPDQWPDRLDKLVALGATAVEVYVAWNVHERYARQHYARAPAFRGQ